MTGRRLFRLLLFVLTPLIGTVPLVLSGCLLMDLPVGALLSAQLLFIVAWLACALPSVLVIEAQVAGSAYLRHRQKTARHRATPEAGVLTIWDEPLQGGLSPAARAPEPHDMMGLR